MNDHLSIASDTPKIQAGGLLAVWMNIAGVPEPEFRDWYLRQHLAERVGITGFQTGFFYESIAGSPRFHALYETDSVAVFSGAEYRRRVDAPTEWTRKMMPGFRDTVRCTCRIVGHWGDDSGGLGGILRTCRMERVAGGGETLDAEAVGAVLAELAQSPGIVRVRLAEYVRAEDLDGSAEKAIRGQDRSAPFTIFAEATGADAVRSAWETILPPARMAPLGIAAAPEIGDYRLLHGLPG